MDETSSSIQPTWYVYLLLTETVGLLMHAMNEGDNLKWRGEFLAFTGEKLNGAELVACDFATHYSLNAVLYSIRGEFLAFTGEKLNRAELVACDFATHYSLNAVCLPPANRNSEFLAFTGEKLNGAELVACDFATHYSLNAVLYSIRGGSNGSKVCLPPANRNSEFLTFTGEKLNGAELVACDFATHYSLNVVLYSIRGGSNGSKVTLLATHYSLNVSLLIYGRGKFNCLTPGIATGLYNSTSDDCLPYVYLLLTETVDSYEPITKETT
ncbi:hypothetical protein Tco_0478721 [Tanacetum coccineum]